MNIRKSLKDILVPYDYIIVGAGMTGCTIAALLTGAGFFGIYKNKRVLVIEKREDVGGNCTDEVDYNTNVMVHQYGAHIFRTSDEDVWNFVNEFEKMHPFVHKVLANYKGELYSFPINFMTVSKISESVRTPEEMKEWITERKTLPKENPNLEEHCTSMIGKVLYEMFIKGYTKKQWGKEPSELPASIIKRIPIRYTANDSYFGDDKIYQGIPEKGYTNMMEKMLQNCDVIFDCDFLKNKEKIESLCKNKIIYTGAIDEFFGVEGQLEWRSLRFVEEERKEEYFQPAPVVNYTSEDVEFTRIIEHKHFMPWRETKGTYITKEFPLDWEPGRDKFYPVPTEDNLEKVRNLLLQVPDNYIFAGRLAEYKYYDMDVAILNAAKIASQLE